MMFLYFVLICSVVATNLRSSSNGANPEVNVYLDPPYRSQRQMRQYAEYQTMLTAYINTLTHKQMTDRNLMSVVLDTQNNQIMKLKKAILDNYLAIKAKDDSEVIDAREKTLYQGGD